MLKNSSLYRIRPAVMADCGVVMALVDDARAIMRASGNALQWSDGYPQRSVIEDDIRTKVCYVVVMNGDVVASFVCRHGPDITYRTIDGGSWIDPTSPYYVVHRITSRKGCHGLFPVMCRFWFTLCPNIRIDTHADNVIMRHLLTKYGFSYCGIIHLLDGDPRLAYQKVL